MPFPFPIRPKMKVAAGLALLSMFVAVGFIGLRGSGDAGPEATPAPIPTVVAVAGELRVVPGGDLEALANELSPFLTDLYERAFLPPLPAPTPAPTDPPSPAPTPRPRPPVVELFTPAAAAALVGAPEVFSPGADATVYEGTVTFRGVASTTDGRPSEALLDIDFTASGILVDPVVIATPAAAVAPKILRLKQTGQLYLEQTEDGWRVAGFEMEITTERGTPPTPSPEAS